MAQLRGDAVGIAGLAIRAVSAQRVTIRIDRTADVGSGRAQPRLGTEYCRSYGVAQPIFNEAANRMGSSHGARIRSRLIVSESRGLMCS